MSEFMITWFMNEQDRTGKGRIEKDRAQDKTE